MDNILLHEYHIPVKGIKRKTIYHFSDTHLAEFDELSTEKEIAGSKKTTEAWERVRRSFAESHGEPFGEAQMLPAKEHFKNLMNASKDGDAVIIAGDMFDYVSVTVPKTDNILIHNTESGKYISILFSNRYVCEHRCICVTSLTTNTAFIVIITWKCV